MLEPFLYSCSSIVQPSHEPPAAAFSTGSRVAATLAGARIPALVLSGRYVQLYNASQHLSKTIRVHGLQGAVPLDRQGNIYYESYDGSNNGVSIYRPPYTGKPKVISFSSLGDAVSIAIDSRSGVFAVTTNAFDQEPEYYAAIWFFRHGATAPCAVVKEPSDWAWAGTATFDATGTLFTVGTSGGYGVTLVSASGQCDAKHIVSYSPALPNALRLQFNAENELVVEESTGFNNPPIATYLHPANGQLGSPLVTTMLQELDGQPAAMLTLTSDGTQLWASNFSNEVALYNYPQGGSPLQVLNLDKIGGGAVYPPLTP